MSKTAKFTLRFRNKQTHKLLGAVADQFGVSQNRLAEQMLERELGAAALLVEQDLAGTLRRLHDYRGQERLEDDIEDFAAGEAFGDDPLQARMVGPVKLVDAYGVMDAFNVDA